jgi:Na+-driven multidrug efflux pump
VSETAAGIKQQSDFSKGSVSANILSLALPLTVAQLINVLYNVVDRIYIGHIPGASSAALTGVGVTFPILSIVIAFANLFGTGGAPLFSIARGRGDDAHAADIMGNTFTMLLGTGLVWSDEITTTFFLSMAISHSLGVPMGCSSASCTSWVPSMGAL